MLRQSHARASAARETLEQRHVLVIEDEFCIRAMVADVLEDAGYAVLQAGDGLEAVRQLHTSRPDLIVLDLTLPGMSGWQFLETTREQLESAGIPVLILSALERRQGEPQRLGVAAWITKPLDMNRFLRAVEDLAGRPRWRPRQAQRLSRTGRVLVVEDDPLIRNIIVEHLTGEGIPEPRVAGSVAEARTSIEAERPSLIMLDLMLPLESGWDFLRERRADPLLAPVPVIVVSAAPQDLLREASHLGADALMSKPFDLDALTAVVRSFIG